MIGDRELLCELGWDRSILSPRVPSVNGAPATEEELRQYRDFTSWIGDPGLVDHFEGVRAKAVREFHGWTQQHLADYLGVTKGTISRWENGRRSPDGSVGRQYIDLVGEAQSEVTGVLHLLDFLHTATSEEWEQWLLDMVPQLVEWGVLSEERGQELLAEAASHS